MDLVTTSAAAVATTTNTANTTSSTMRMASSSSSINSSSVIPPVARRKLQMRAQRQQAQRVATLMWGALLGLSLIGFFIYHHTVVRTHPVFRSRNGGKDATSTVRLRGAQQLSQKQQPWVRQNSLPFNQDNLARKAHHLIMVAGHSVTISGNLEDAGVDERVWFLLDYQKGKGLPQAIVAHIQAGIWQAADDPDSLLIFSGGETRALTGPLTEGSSYFRVADALQLWQSNVRARSVTEEFATDSFENLLFSICRFKEVTGAYPTKITVVSFTFKQRRFETLHAPALQWPSDRFHYIGVDPPSETGFDLEQATRGELENAAQPFESDPYGCHSPTLQEKRQSRNPFSRTPPYELSCPELKDLLHYCGPKLFPKELLPWKNL